jgi:hypothetical protein
MPGVIQIPKVVSTFFVFKGKSLTDILSGLKISLGKLGPFQEWVPVGGEGIRKG